MTHLSQVSLAAPLPVQSVPAASRQGLAVRRRAALLVFVATAVAAGILVTGGAAAQLAAGQAGPDLTRLLRAMALMKSLAAMGLVAVVLWRLAAPIALLRLTGYALACVAMAAGPGLIWTMAHLRLGALLLHGGLLTTVLLLWRDPAMQARLAQAVACRRAVLHARR